MGNLRAIKTEAHRDERDKVDALLRKYNKLRAVHIKLYARDSAEYVYTLEAIRAKMLAIIDELRGDENDVQEETALMPIEDLTEMLIDLTAMIWGKTGEDILESAYQKVRKQQGEIE